MRLQTAVLWFLPLSFLLTAGQAGARWVEYGDNGKATFHYDDQSIRTRGATAIVDEMLNYGFPLRGVLSNRSTKEFDCLQQKFRYLSGEFYSERDLGGKKISESGGEDEAWRPVVEGTQNEQLMRIACGTAS